MVELERKPPQFLTFRYGDAAATIPVQDKYRVNDAIKIIISGLGIKTQDSKVYEAINRLAPDSGVSNQDDQRMNRSLTQNHLQIVVNHFIESHEAKKNKNIRSSEITDDEIIDLEGITDYKWLTCEPLLCELRTTRIQTESGEVQISPISYEKVRSLFPNDTGWMTIYKTLQMLNNSLAPSGWSIVRQGEATKKPIDAPWFLRRTGDKPEESPRNPGSQKKPSRDSTPILPPTQEIKPLPTSERILESPEARKERFQSPSEDPPDEENGDEDSPQEIEEARQNTLKKQARLQLALNILNAVRSGKLQTLDKDAAAYIQNSLPPGISEPAAKGFITESINAGLNYWDLNDWDLGPNPSAQERELIETCKALRIGSRHSKQTKERVIQEIQAYFSLP